MGFSSLLLAAFIGVGVAGCAEAPDHPPAPPKIEGHFKSVSSADISKVIALTEQDMLKHVRRVVPIEYLRVVDRDHIQVSYWYAHGSTQRWMELRRVHGVWSLPNVQEVIVSG